MPTPSSSDPARRGRGKPPSGGGRPPRTGGRPPQERVSEGPPWKRRQEDAAKKGKAAGWGGVARKGAGYVGATNGPGTASEAFRDAVEGTGRTWEPEQWIDEGIVRDEAKGAIGRGRAPGKPAPRKGRGVVDDESAEDPSLQRAVGAAKVERVEQRMKEASRAFKRERFEEARKILRPLAESAPTAVSVRELLGLTYYRLGRWKLAVAELEAFRDLTGSTEQHPVLADCYRALGRHAKVAELWEELRDVSPSAPLVAEGRIVAAGSLADRGELRDAISLLEAAKHPSKRPQEHHLRVAYALADLYERAGDLPKARQLFQVVASADPELGDAATRFRALG